MSSTEFNHTLPQLIVKSQPSFARQQDPEKRQLKQSQKLTITWCLKQAQNKHQSQNK